MKKILVCISTASVLIMSATVSCFVANALSADVNSDGVFDISDISELQNWLIKTENTVSDLEMADLNNDNKINVVDLTLMKYQLSDSENISDENIVYVSDSAELKSALENAEAGEKIVLASGTYVYDGTVVKWHTFECSADGTQDAPITLCSQDPDNPAIIDGTTTESYYGLTITGDWWNIENIVVTNASKGIIVDNSNHTTISGCEVYNIGSEGIHIRDGSSECTIDNSYIHDTGVVNPGYGEGVYIGSAESTTEYDHYCDNNTVKNCKIGPNVGSECVDIKEYTTGTLVENCTFDAKGCSGQNYTKAFINIKGNDCTVRYCIGYRNGNEYITRAFEQNNVVDGWGQNAYIYSNKVYMDTKTNANGGKMYFLSSWDCSCTVGDNYMAYDGDLFTVDNKDEQWDYYNCNLITYMD